MPNDNYIQDDKTIFRARGYHVAALAMFDKGFTAEAHRKDAIDYLNRAYDVLVIEAIHYALWSQRTDNGDRWVWDNEEAKNLDHNHSVPALHVWNKDKHGKLYAAYPAAVKIANILRADRDAIKAAPLAKKPVSKSRKIEINRAAKAKTCQICGRPILAERGNIAHHGYQRPGDGWQTASCFGAMHLPFEVSRDRLGEYIVILKTNLASTKRTRAGVEDETYSLRVSYSLGKYGADGKPLYGSFMASRKTYDASREEHSKLARWPTSDLPKTFDEVKARELHRLDRDIEEQETYLTLQQGRFNKRQPAQEKVA